MSDQVFWNESRGLAMSARDTARALGISARTLFTLTKKGIVPHVRLGRRVLYPIAELREWMERRMNRGNAIES